MEVQVYLAALLGLALFVGTALGHVDAPRPLSNHALTNAESVDAPT